MNELRTAIVVDSAIVKFLMPWSVTAENLYMQTVRHEHLILGTLDQLDVVP